MADVCEMGNILQQILSYQKQAQLSLFTMPLRSVANDSSPESPGRSKVKVRWEYEENVVPCSRRIGPVVSHGAER